jgi:hypothetical protein
MMTREIKAGDLATYSGNFIVENGLREGREKHAQTQLTAAG